ECQRGSDGRRPGMAGTAQVIGGSILGLLNPPDEALALFDRVDQASLRQDLAAFFGPDGEAYLDTRRAATTRCSPGAGRSSSFSSPGSSIASNMRLASSFWLCRSPWRWCSVAAAA